MDHEEAGILGSYICAHTCILGRSLEDVSVVESKAVREDVVYYLCNTLCLQI